MESRTGIEAGELTGMEAKKQEERVFGNVGKIRFGKKTVLIPEMNRATALLLAATLRGFGVEARVLETYKGLDLGKEYTSGKECYPCQVTLGDILYFVQKEKQRLGPGFDPGQYVYFMPESEGPCRFGLYNRFQRIVLDSFPGLERLTISSITTRDGYSFSGILEREKVLDFQKSGFFAVIVADIMDRLLWRIRPYEKEQGVANEFVESSLRNLEKTFENQGPSKRFEKILDDVLSIVEEGKAIIDPNIPPKPLIGIVGEIFLRTHVQSNQDIIRLLENHGAEVVNASVAEWANYVSYDGLRAAKAQARLNLKQMRFSPLWSKLKELFGFGIDLYYKEHRQNQVYRRVQPVLDLIEDHKISHLEKILKEKDLFSFDVATEACLSIASILSCARAGYNGMVNVYPFTCMPSTTTSAVIKPVMSELGIPYLDAPYDSSIQPGREAAIRTFMYQAEQHFRRHGRMQRTPSH
jgi:predicted nucleotide-binding protein (sugar kinase/HSP70/actin superfamily)